MRLTHFSHLDKPRPLVELTRKLVRTPMANAAVAPRTSTDRGLNSGIRVGKENNLEGIGAISCGKI